MARAIVVAAVVIAADQLTKAWALVALDDGPIDLIGSLRLNLAFNKGAAFSLGGERLGPLIAVVTIVVAVLLLRAVRVLGSPLAGVGAGLVLGGAVGNIADRAFRGDGGFFDGAVVDFVDLQWWPVFNVADSAIVVGAVLYVLAGLRTES
ncbi:N/A [soil metagenome]